MSNPKNKKKKFLDALFEEKGLDRDKMQMLANSIAYHESKLDPKVSQKGGGPGRGLFQFEMGKNNGAHIAAKRYKRLANQYGVEPNEEIINLSGDYDISNLSPQAQQELFFAYHRGHPKADLTAFDGTKEAAHKFWANYHNADAYKDPNDPRNANFLKDFDDYLSKKEMGGTLALDGLKIGIDTFNVLNNIEQQQKRMANMYAPKLGDNTNPYMKNGGKLDAPGFKQYNTGSHATGNDLPVNAQGIPDGKNPVAKVEKNENSYNNHVYSDSLENPKTGNTFAMDMSKLIKKYKNAALNSIDKSSLDFEASQLAKSNEIEKAKAEQAQMTNMGYGGKLKKMAWGGKVNPYMDYGDPEGEPGFMNKMPNFDMSSVTDPEGTFEDNYPNLAKNAPSTPASGTSPSDDSANSIGNYLNFARIGKGIEALGKSAMLLGGVEKDQARINPEYDNVKSKVAAASQFDLTSVKNDLKGAANAALGKANNTAGGAGLRNAMASQIQSNLMRNLGQVGVQEQQLKSRANLQGAGILGNLGQQKAAALERSDIRQSQNQGAFNTIIGSMLESVGAKGAFETNAAISQAQATEVAKLLQAKYPNATITDEAMKAMQSGNWEKVQNLIKVDFGK